MHINTRNARIWVHDQGEGPALLLLGGTSDPAESWQAQIDAFSDRYRVTAPDNRGAGRSPLPPAGVTIEGMAEDAADVLRHLGIEDAHLAIRTSSAASCCATPTPARTPTSARWSAAG